MEAWRCRCGSVAGTLDLSGAVHLVCYCKDCRRFAELLAAGTHVLDQAGGTALVQVRVDALSLAAGRGSLCAMHLTDRPSLRWYTGCCDTPPFNTYAHGRVPYLPVVSANLDREARRRLGPPGFALSTGSATRVPLARPSGAIRAVSSIVGRMIRDAVSGARRRNPLFYGPRLLPIAPVQRHVGDR